MQSNDEEPCDAAHTTVHYHKLSTKRTAGRVRRDRGAQQPTIDPDTTPSTPAAAAPSTPARRVAPHSTSLQELGGGGRQGVEPRGHGARARRAEAAARAP